MESFLIRTVCFGPEAIELLNGTDLIFHAGDIGKPGVIEQLQTIAPVKAIRGNIDKDWPKQYPETDAFKYENRCFYILHDLNELDLDPTVAAWVHAKAGIAA